MPVPKVPPEFDELSTSEKIEYVQQLWERIAEDSETVELTDTQRAELDRRLEAHRENPNDAIPWDEVKRDPMKGRLRVKLSPNPLPNGDSDENDADDPSARM